MQLSATNVRNILYYCLFKPEELNENGLPKDSTKIVGVEGIINKFGFHSDRLKEKESEIIELLRELPDEFFESSGGGWSFLNACQDKEGHQWGEHADMEALFVLGMGINKVKYSLPRELWESLPGGMPYIEIDL